MKIDDYSFAILCWALVLGPGLWALITGSLWWLLLYVPVVLIFGMA